MAIQTTLIHLNWHYCAVALFAFYRNSSVNQRRMIRKFFIIFYGRPRKILQKKPLFANVIVSDCCNCYFPYKFKPETVVLLQMFDELPSCSSGRKLAWLSAVEHRSGSTTVDLGTPSLVNTDLVAQKSSRLVEIKIDKWPLCQHLAHKFRRWGHHWQMDSGIVVISPALQFNVGLGGLGRLPMLKLEEALSFSVVDCSEARLALVRSPMYDLNPEPTTINQSLRSYFTQPRLVSLGDVLAVENSEQMTGWNDKKSFRLFYFKVCDMFPASSGFICDSTRLYQIANVHSLIPRTMNGLYSSNNHYMVGIGPTGIPSVDKSVENIVARCQSHVLMKSFKSFTTEPDQASVRILNIFLYGGIGSGKNLVVEAVASCLHCHLFKINCFELLADSVGSVETKLENLLKQAISSRPIVIHLSHFEVFAKNLNSGEIDIRLIRFFRQLLTTHESDNDNIIVLVATAVSQDVNSDLSSLFDHQVAMEPLSENDRLQALKCHLAHRCINVNLDDIAKKTAGFTLLDLEVLVAKSERLCFEDGGNHGWTIDHFARALDQMKLSAKSGMGAPSIPNVQWDDVGGLMNVKRVITDAIELSLEHPELFSTGLRRSGILLYGPPGCGKTLLAKAVASECNLNFFSVKGPELLNMYVGQSEQNIREVFSRARAASPCVIFFDELDSLAPNRGRSGDSGGVMDRVVSQLLAELDGMSSFEDKTEIFVIGATNRPDLIDSSLLRPGRFEKVLYVGMNDDDEIAKLQVLKACCRKLSLSEDVDLKDLVRRSPRGLTGADYSSLVSGAVLHCMSRLIRVVETENLDEESIEIKVNMEDFESSLSELCPSVAAGELDRYKTIQSRLKA